MSLTSFTDMLIRAVEVAGVVVKEVVAEVKEIVRKVREDEVKEVREVKREENAVEVEAVVAEAEVKEGVGEDKLSEYIEPQLSLADQEVLRKFNHYEYLKKHPEEMKAHKEALRQRKREYARKRSKDERVAYGDTLSFTVKRGGDVKCEVCGTNYVDQKGLQRHMKTLKHKACVNALANANVVKE